MALRLLHDFLNILTLLCGLAGSDLTTSGALLDYIT
jgi:hypothetical protein